MIHLENVSVDFSNTKETIKAVDNITLNVKKSEIFGIVGYSGAGKSTLVRVINLLQKPSEGTVLVNNQNLTKLSPSALRQARKKIGMIFQHFNLMKSRTVFGNVAYALRGTKLSANEKKEKIHSLVELVGLGDKANAYPSQLSGGQKQRVAIARALANDPQILLCDEATSALDPKTTISILQLLKHLNRSLGLTIVLITHEMQVVKEICHKVAVMEDGKIIEQGDIVSIFSNPQKPLTQDFIRTATHIDQAFETIKEHPSLTDLNSEQELLEFSYSGAATEAPIIARLFSKFQVETNILYGNVEILCGVPVGQLIVILTGDDHNRRLAKNYLVSIGVAVKPLKAQNTGKSVKLQRKIIS